MNNYFGTSINESPVVAGMAGAEIVSGAFLAAKHDAGGVVLAGAGEVALGILLSDTEAKVAKGDRVTVQVKDICRWKTGGEVKAGDLLACDAEGRAVKAVAGAFILAQALEEATAADRVIQVQVIKAGFQSAPVGG